MNPSSPQPLYFPVRIAENWIFDLSIRCITSKIRLAFHKHKIELGKFPQKFILPFITVKNAETVIYGQILIAVSVVSWQILVSTAAETRQRLTS